MLNKNGVFVDKENIIFTNNMGLSNHIKLLYKIIDNMLNDLSIITGIEREYLFENYEYLNGNNIFKELLRKEGESLEEESLALMVIKKKLENIQGE